MTRHARWPAKPLIDLAADRDPGRVELTPELVQAAAEHRLTGLLWSWASQNVPDSELRSQLAFRDLRTQAHLKRVLGLLERSVDLLDSAGIEVASVKGPITERRWYSRPGDRPSSDIDLWLAPTSLDRAGDAVKILQPDHPWLPFFDELVRGRLVQTVTLKAEGIEIDLHVDLLKTGVATRQATDIWASCETFTLDGGTEIPVLDPESALLHFLVHLNKDRFQRLLGYADIVRILGHGVDLERFFDLANGDGLADVARCVLGVVHDDLEIEQPHFESPTAWKARVWRAAWPERIRLRGREGRERFKQRQLLIPALANGRALEAVRSFALEAAPPRPIQRLRSAAVGRSPNRVRMQVARAWDRHLS